MYQQHAFVCILKNYKAIESLLLMFVEQGITGGTVIDSRGMGQILCQDIPIFMHIREHFPDSDSDSHMLLSVVSSDQLELCFELAERLTARQERDEPVAQSGLAFAFPVAQMRKLGEAAQASSNS